MTFMERLVNQVLHQEPGEFCYVYSIFLTITVAVCCEVPLVLQGLPVQEQD